MIDWSRIDEIEQELGADEVPELVAVFLDEVGDAMGPLAQNIQPSEAALHFLKGCALTLGFDDLAKLASDGEARKKASGDCCVDTVEICAAYQNEKSELLERFPMAG